MTERQALGILAVAAMGAMAWLALPFATALILGTLLAFALEPIYERLARYTGRPAAALLIVITSGIVIVGALAGFATLFVARAVALVNTARQQLQSGGPLSVWVDTGTRWLGHFGINTGDIVQRLQAGFGDMASRAGAMAAVLASSTFSALLGLFFALLTLYAVLRHWSRMVDTVVAVSPLNSAYTEALLAEFRSVGRTTMSGTVATGLIQGALATIGYWITGLPYPFFFGFTTALASLVPAVGTLLVWIPAGLYLFATGHPGMAITELLWGAVVVVGLSDYVIRPRLVGDESMPALLLFIALFGGLEVVGLSGLIVGPLVMGLALAVLRLYAREQTAPLPRRRGLSGKTPQ